MLRLWIVDMGKTELLAFRRLAVRSTGYRLPILVSETPLPRKDHGDVSFVASLDAFEIPLGSSRLNNGGDALLNADVQTVAEWKESVGYHATAEQSSFGGGDLLVNGSLSDRVGEMFVWQAVALPRESVGRVPVSFIPRVLGHAHTVLSTRADRNGCAIFDKEHGIAGHSRLDQPPEEQIFAFFVRGQTFNAVFLALVNCGGRDEISLGACFRYERPLDDDTAIDQRLEVDELSADELRKPLHIADAADTQIFLPGEQLHYARLELGGHDYFGVVFADQTCRGEVAGPIEGNGASEGGDAVGQICAFVGFCESLAEGTSAGVIVLDYDGAWSFGQIAQDVQGVVNIGNVGLAGVFSGLEQFHVRGQIAAGLNGFDLSQDKIAVYELVHGSLLTWIFAITQTLVDAVYDPGDLFIDEGLTGFLVREGNFEPGRKMIVHHCFVCCLEVGVTHVFYPPAFAAYLITGCVIRKSKV